MTGVLFCRIIVTFEKIKTKVLKTPHRAPHCPLSRTARFVSFFLETARVADVDSGVCPPGSGARAATSFLSCLLLRNFSDKYMVTSYSTGQCETRSPELTKQQAQASGAQGRCLLPVSSFHEPPARRPQGLRGLRFSPTARRLRLPITFPVDITESH